MFRVHGCHVVIHGWSCVVQSGAFGTGDGAGGGGGDGCGCVGAVYGLDRYGCGGVSAVHVVLQGVLGVVFAWALCAWGGA